MMVRLLSDDLVRRLAFTLLHSVWQAALLAIVAVVITRLIPRRSAELRYAVCAAGMACMPILSIVTFFLYDTAGSAVSRIAGFAPLNALQSAGFIQWTQWMVLFWMTGVALSSIRLSASWLSARRLLRLADVAAPTATAELFERIRKQIGVHKPVRLLLSHRIDVPVVVGWLRPAVLLPISVLTGLDQDQLRAILAHELAHIRRHDFAINLLQRCVESILFYHPAVWWLSSCTRAEREHCCDDLAIRVCGDRLIYAQALVKLEQTRSDASLLAMAINGGSLTSRIGRILGRDATQSDRLSAGLAGVFVGLWLLAGIWQSNTLMAQPATPEFTPMEISLASVTAPEPSLSIVQMALMALSGAQVRPQVSAPAPVAAGAPPQAQKASIEGRVVRSGTAEPVKAKVALRVTVNLDENPNGRPGQFNVRSIGVDTDSDGKFIIKDIPPDTYLLAVSANGFVRQEYGEPSEGAAIGQGKKINLAAGQVMKDLVIRMKPAGSLSGHIRDTDQWPAVGTDVQLLHVTYNVLGQRMLRAVTTTRADDRGEYRFFWVQPGRYYLAAGTFNMGAQPVSANAPQELYAITYYPGVMDLSDATAVEVRPSAELNAIDLVVPKQLSYRIRGRIIDPKAGPGRTPVTVTLTTKAATTNQGQAAPTFQSETYDPATGIFEKTGVKPGAYFLHAQAGTLQLGNPAAGRARIEPPAASATVIVTNADVDGLTLTIAEPIPIPGRLTVEGGELTSLRNWDRLYLGLRSPDEERTNASQTMNADGTFTIGGVLPGTYTVALPRLPPEVYVREVRFGGQDILRGPFEFTGLVPGPIEVVLSAKSAQISGSVVDDKKQGVRDVQVVLIPNRNRERTDLFKTTMTSATGTFTIRGITPGDYKLFAWEGMEPFSYFDADFVQSFEPRGTAVHIDESGKVNVEVRLIPAGGRQ